jgi:hypothetical protein
MEPERKIEKWLRAYAKKRRGQSGDPFSLHPATRRLLHGEIARKSPAPKAGEEESPSLWKFVQRDLLFLGGFALCIFFVAAVFFHGLTLSKDRAQIATAANNLKQINVAAQYAAQENGGRLPTTLDGLTNEMITRKDLIDPQSQKPFVFAAAGKNLSDLPSNAVLAYSPEDKNGRAVLFADGRIMHANKKEFDEISNAANAPLVAMNNVQSLQPATGLPADEAGAIVAVTNNMTIAESAAPMQPMAPPTPTATLSGESSVAPPPATAGPEPSVAPAPTMAETPPPPAMTPPATEVAANDTLAIRAPVAQPAPANFARAPVQAEKEQLQTFAAQRMISWGVQNDFKNTIVPAQNVSVLANFQIQQNGNAIRVVDEDGSVYDGSIQTDNGIAANGGATSDAERTRETSNTANEPAGVARALPSASQQQPQQQLQAAQNYFFRVAGMNRTLNQTVAFSGTLVPAAVSSVAQQSFWQNYNADQTKADRSANRDTVQQQSQQNVQAAQQLPWASFRITGTAVINSSNQIQILATPVTSTNN